jgi:hypothetical protein
MRLKRGDCFDPTLPAGILITRSVKKHRDRSSDWGWTVIASSDSPRTSANDSFKNAGSVPDEILPSRLASSQR